MIFNTFWTILLGVIGGIVSSLIVSRVFLIQGEYQQQLDVVTHVFRRINYISAYLNCSKAIFQVSYDQDIEIKREMQEKGYRTKEEYYNAHRNEDWIKKSDVLELFKKEINNTIININSEIDNAHIKDKKMLELLYDAKKYAHEVASVKELSFKRIENFADKEKALQEQYNKCVKASGKKLCGLILKDKLMIILFILVSVLLSGTIITKIFGI